MKVAVLLLAVLVAASAAPEKRFIKDTFESIGHWFSHTWDSAKNEFNHLTSGIHINFNSVVQNVTLLIDSGMTEHACKTACVESSPSVLGPAADLSGTVCSPVCKAALARLEQTAGK